MKKLIFSTLVYLVSITTLFAQSIFQNPSFEGPPKPDVTPTPWSVCGGTPDTQPGQYGVSNVAFDGNTYLGIQGVEGASQRLSVKLTAGVNYTMELFLAFGSYLASPIPGDLCIYGGFSNCDQTELLWSSAGKTINADWDPFTVSFTPTKNFSYVSFIKCGPVFFSNVLVDNISSIIENKDLSAVASVDKSLICAGDCINLTGKGSGGSGSPYKYTWTSKPTGFNSNTESPGTVCPIVNTKYFLKVEDASTSYTDSVYIKVVDAPKADAGKDTVMCIGSSYQLQAKGGLTYKWNPSLGLSKTNISNPIAKPTKTTKYFVIVTDSIGCSDQDSLLITVLSKPKSSFTYEKDSLNVNFNGTNLDNVFQWEWDFGDRSSIGTTQNPNHTYLQPGEYTITLVVWNSCGSDTVYFSIIVDGQKGDGGSPTYVRSTQNTLKNIKIFPNPTVDELNIEYTITESIPVNIEIIDISGKRMYTQSFNDAVVLGPNHIVLKEPISTLKKGIYFIRFLTKDDAYILKFQK